MYNELDSNQMELFKVVHDVQKVNEDEVSLPKESDMLLIRTFRLNL